MQQDLSYIRQITGLSDQEINDISLSDWIESNNEEDNPYILEEPRLISPRGSLYAYYGRFIPDSLQ